ncbi:MAG: cyclopropane-fatty-acyl-phospholipid synthase family protein, partial [Pseudomonadota bacterium]
GRTAMFFALKNVLKRCIRAGSLIVVDPDGGEHRFGDGQGKTIKVRLHDRWLAPLLVLRPDPVFGEAYADGRLTLEQGTVYDLLDLLLPQFDFGRAYALRSGAALNRIVHSLGKLNTVTRARMNVEHHYDLSGEFYDLFLDSDRQYSCAYFEPGEGSLHRAQLAKKRHIAAKLNIEPGMDVLDIGCGWGGFALYLAENCGARVTGITLSSEQAQLARQRVRNRRLEGRIEIRLIDYREVEGAFDRVVSVGMFEHVGPRHFQQYFNTVRELLAVDGVALIHTIGRPHGPYPTSTWIERYIFPGGYLPALSEMQQSIERSGLYLCDVEVLRLHYAETLRHWRQRFKGHWEDAANIYDERFCRIWEYYLAGSEAAFRQEYSNVFQLQLARHQNALPQTRSYMVETEERLRRIDGKSCRPRSVRARSG